jgi:hypothetical protein
MVMQWTVNPPPLARLVRSQDTPPLVVLFWKNSVYTRVMHCQCPLCPAGIGNTVKVRGLWVMPVTSVTKVESAVATASI